MSIKSKKIEIKEFIGANLWKVIIEQWIKNNVAYIKATNSKDCIYWHNEYANVASLLGAIWQIGGVGTVEFETIKNIKGKEKEGRIDLYFKKDNIQYLCEAKFLRQKDITLEKIDAVFKSALEDSNISSRANPNIENIMSLLFIVPIGEQDLVKIFNSLENTLDIYVELEISEQMTYKNKINDINTYNRVNLIGKYRTNRECSK